MRPHGEFNAEEARKLAKGSPSLQDRYLHKILDQIKANATYGYTLLEIDYDPLLDEIESDLESLGFKIQLHAGYDYYDKSFITW